MQIRMVSSSFIEGITIEREGIPSYTAYLFITILIYFINLLTSQINLSQINLDVGRELIFTTRI
jgi:hypothetical protein